MCIRKTQEGVAVLMSGTDHEGFRPPVASVGFFLLIVVGGTLDVILDGPREWWSAHVLIELGLIAVSLGAAAYLWAGWVRTGRTLEAAQNELEHRRDEVEAWRDSIEATPGGLRRAVERKFDEWKLTPTEQDTALHLMRGRSHKRIARLTERSERTVRQHSVAVYKKSGLSGRAELAGFFLSGLVPALDEEHEPPATA